MTLRGGFRPTSRSVRHSAGCLRMPASCARLCTLPAKGAYPRPVSADFRTNSCRRFLFSPAQHGQGTASYFRFEEFEPKVADLCARTLAKACETPGPDSCTTSLPWHCLADVVMCANLALPDGSKGRKRENLPRLRKLSAQAPPRDPRFFRRRRPDCGPARCLHCAASFLRHRTRSACGIGGFILRLAPCRCRMAFASPRKPGMPISASLHLRRAFSGAGR